MCYAPRIMSATRSLWRPLLTILQIVVLVAFSLVSAGHSHAGTAHAGHATAASVAPSGAQGMEPGSDRVCDEAGACGLCCCHASLVRWDAFAVTVTWRPERRLTGLRAVAFDSLAPETLPEPPRPFA